MSPILVDHWPYYLGNYLIAALIWTCLGRALLGLFFRPEAPNYIWRFFRRLTDPVLRVFAPLTPGFLMPGLVPVVVAFYLFVARVLLWVAMYNLGLAPRLSDYGVAG